MAEDFFAEFSRAANNYVEGDHNDVMAENSVCMTGYAKLPNVFKRGSRDAGIR